MSPAEAPAPLSPADLVLLNATVRTVDPARPTAQAVAILGERIGAVGATADIRSLVGPRTRVLDLGRRLGP